MSNFADPSKSRLWLDGDAFRAAAGTAIPADIFAASLSGWDAFGGIQAGFTIERPRNVEKLTIWNAEGTYRQKKDQEEPSIQLRPVDLSKATALTLLTGGSLVSANGGLRWDEGDEEFFAMIVRVVDGTSKAAYYMEKSELANRPTEVLNDEQLMGWDMEVSPLIPDGGGKPLIRFTDPSYNPLT
jgi:hypothetical protein